MKDDRPSPSLVRQYGVRLHSGSPIAYRMGKRGCEYVLQACFQWQDAEGFGFEWQDQPTIELPPEPAR
jgi:hypothetical protein